VVGKYPAPFHSKHWLHLDETTKMLLLEAYDTSLENKMLKYDSLTYLGRTPVFTLILTPPLTSIPDQYSCSTLLKKF
jgi:hypothetical protein